MADALSAEIKASLTWLFQETLDLATVSDSSKLEYHQSLADGTGNNQADKIWHDTRTLSPGANDDLDLTALANTIFGSTVTINLVKVKAILIVNTAAAAGEDLVIGNGPTPFLGPFGAGAHTLRCEADSCLLLANRVDGWTVTNVTADILRINNAGTGEITYKIAVVGTSA